MSRIYQPSSTMSKPVSTSPLPPPSSSSSSSTHGLLLTEQGNHQQQQYSPPLQQQQAGGEKMSQDLLKLITRLETVTNRLENISVPSNQSNATSRATSASAPTTNGHQTDFNDLPSIVAFDALLTNSFEPFVQLSAKIGNDVKTIISIVEKLFKLERSFLVEAARSTQPQQDALMKFYQTFGALLGEVSNFREKNRKSELFNHLSAISESIAALCWIQIQPAPCPHIKEMIDSAQFYTNRVLKDYKEKDVNHVNWSKQWLQLLTELQQYVKQYHTTGLVWNSSKKSDKFDVGRVLENQSNGNAPTSGGPPPPPPPPPMPDFNQLLAEEQSKSSSSSSSNANAELFAAINQGSAITQKLRAVPDSEKTHKNPNLRQNNTVPGGVSSSSAVSSKTPTTTKAAVVNKPPVFELVDKKWKIEYQTKGSQICVDQTDLKHTVYIYQCRECTITVKGKVNSILIDSCTRVGLVFDDVLSTVEFINSNSVQMQVLGKVPTVSIEKTDGCQVYLSANSLDTEIVSSKSSAMNILVPCDKVEGDYVEQPVPEQFKTVIRNRKLVTTATETA